MFARAAHTRAVSRALAVTLTPDARRPPTRLCAPAPPVALTLVRSFFRRSDAPQEHARPPQLGPEFVTRELQIPLDTALPCESLNEAIPDSPISVLRTVTGIRHWASAACRDRSHGGVGDQGLALVPTMGALHEGHLRLIRDAVRRGHNKIVVSIYVNPAQFGVAEDLDSYPKTWEADCAVLRALHKELVVAGGEPLEMAVFAPTTRDMYPSGFPGQEVDSDGSFVTMTPVGGLLEGRTRPTFFRGVATVCMKLFNIVQPTRVFFGQKDVQQTVVIRKMVRDFCMPLDVAVVPTVRDASDSLALSSRNVYLGTRRRRVAPVLIRALRAAEHAYRVHGALDAGEVVPAALKVILDTLEEQKDLPPHEGVMFQLDYVSLADPDTMEEIDEIDPSKGAILSGAIKMLPVFEPQEGEDLGHNNGPPVRLIDNIILPPRR
ncbi:pantothenate synthetase [Diaporthe helianthi]|uniref:Pantoate--beta-alanine ligase n=1 Tax=Diaporthe helianthi TaxID=158607 RepID=A0A2P5HGR9_DIAHE|nr:pantothenate synthetase [Diaporthe helianthi]